MKSKFIPNDDIIEASLPFEFRVYFAGVFGYADFVSTDDGCKVLRLGSEFVF